MKPLLFVKSTISLVSHEESFTKHGPNLLIYNHKTSSSVFVSKFVDQKKSNCKGNIQQCKNCGIKGRSIEKCFKLIGYPKDYKPISKLNSKTKNLLAILLLDTIMRLLVREILTM